MKVQEQNSACFFPIKRTEWKKYLIRKDKSCIPLQALKCNPGAARDISSSSAAASSF